MEVLLRDFRLLDAATNIVVLNSRATVVDALHPEGVAVNPRQNIGAGLPIADFAPGTNAYLTLYLRMPTASRSRYGITLLTAPLTATAGRIRTASPLHLHSTPHR